MAKSRIEFVCQNCGTSHPRWSGKCDGCGEWNTLVESGPDTGIASGPGRAPRKGRIVEKETLDGESKDEPRIS
ncbi:MAG: DNA repair protein RadA, partial [Pseudomonadota bacterium]